MRPTSAWAIVAILLGVLVAPARAGVRATSGPVHRLPLAALGGAISVSVVPVAGGATLQSGVGASVAELGTIGGHRPLAAGVTVVRRPGSYDVISAIGLRADAPFGGTVALQAFLDGPIPGVRVRLDGVDLTTIPRTFAVHVPPGVVTRHRVELIVSNALGRMAIPSAIPIELGAVAD